MKKKKTKKVIKNKIQENHLPTLKEKKLNEEINVVTPLHLNTNILTKI